MFRELSPRRLKSWLEREPESLFILDVRQPFEAELARIEPSTLIPLDQLHHHLDTIPTDVRIVCLCHHGMRSAHACTLLAQAGHTRLYNLTGGIDQWSLTQDPSVPRY
ncbi:MAG: rhodanese-like domain-containing protein [Myxococcota bacterium]